MSVSKMQPDGTVRYAATAPVVFWVARKAGRQGAIAKGGAARWETVSVVPASNSWRSTLQWPTEPWPAWQPPLLFVPKFLSETTHSAGTSQGLDLTFEKSRP